MILPFPHQIYSRLSTTILQFAAKAAIAPRAASQGARTTPITPMVAGISSSTLPFSFFTIILVIFPSWSSSLTLSIRLSEETEYSSRVTFVTGAPQEKQNRAPFSNFAPHLIQKDKYSTHNGKLDSDFFNFFYYFINSPDFCIVNIFKVF
jgi:hypothetical protein